MASEKDRLGDKLRDLERAREDDYFAKRDRQLIERLRQSGPDEEKTLREVAHMRCPKCGAHLQSTKRFGVSVDECGQCHGVWLDHGELQQIAKGENDGWIARWLRREFETTEPDHS